MKTLVLMRHAKSSWNDENLTDFERPLNHRGENAAKIMGTYLKNRKVILDLVLTSPAVRARRTTEIVMKAAKQKPEVRLEERIYEAPVGRLLETISQIESGRNSVLLVGHNPGLEALIQLLTGYTEAMPTGTVAKITLNISKWEDASEKGGELDWIVRPKELTT
jgi:phosphohistidine phosphatase